MLLAPKCEAQKCFNNSESVYNLYNNKIAAWNRQVPTWSEDIRSVPWRRRSGCHQACQPNQNSWCFLETVLLQWWGIRTRRHQCAGPCACHGSAWRYDPNLAAQRTGLLRRGVSSPRLRQVAKSHNYHWSWLIDIWTESQRDHGFEVCLSGVIQSWVFLSKLKQSRGVTISYYNYYIIYNIL